MPLLDICLDKRTVQQKLSRIEPISGTDDGQRKNNKPKGADAGGLSGFLSMYVAEAAALSIDGGGDPSLMIRSEAEAYALQHGSAPHYPCIRNCPAEGLASSGSD